MRYCEDDRGKIQYADYARQLVSFEGMKFTGIDGKLNGTPTDVDGLIQLDRWNCIILFELKHKGGHMPDGQRIALTRLCDAVQRSGVHCVLFLAEHHADEPDDIIAKDAIIQGYYMQARNEPHCMWHCEKQGRTLKEMMDRYIEYIKEQDDEQYGGWVSA